MSARLDPENLEIECGWLVERDPDGGDYYGGHVLPGSDCTPLIDLSELPGWLSFSPEQIERAAKKMMREGHGWILPEGIMAIRAVVAALKDAA